MVDDKPTGRLRLVDKTEFMNDKDPHKTRTLQQEFWDGNSDGTVRYYWRDVPVVKITELGQECK